MSAVQDGAVLTELNINLTQNMIKGSFYQSGLWLDHSNILNL